jgi:hypothetical protein
MKKLYLCCTKPKCGSFRQTLEMMQLWGLSPTVQSEGDRRYVDVTIPPYWGDKRRKRFSEAMANLPKKH